jgi:hypothetical protein
MNELLPTNDLNKRYLLPLEEKLQKIKLKMYHALKASRLTYVSI